MSIERVREYLKQWEADMRIQEFPVSSATVELAAAALQCEPGRIAKTLSFAAYERTLLIVAAGDARVNNGKFKKEFGVKAKMLSAEQVEECTGFRVGGVCPFAAKPGAEVFLDQSLKRFQTVFPACGSSNSAIEVSLEELEEFSRAAGWVDVCAVREE